MCGSGGGGEEDTELETYANSQFSRFYLNLATHHNHT